MVGRPRRLSSMQCNWEWVCPDVNGTALSDDSVPSWQEFADANLLWPCLVQLLVALLLFYLAPIYYRAYSKKGRFYSFITGYIGTELRPCVRHPAFMVSCCILQLLFSIAETIIYASRTYSRSKGVSYWYVEIGLSLFFAFHYWVLRLQEGLRPRYAWYCGALIDCFTIVPVLIPLGIDLSSRVETMWLSLKFLRSFRALQAFRLLTKSSDVSELSRKILLVVFEFMAMVISMGGVVFVLEILGEIPRMSDAFIETPMGELSFWQMTYWIVTTVSTVGYGDFSPTTVLSRGFIIVFIYLGIMFFGYQTQSISELYLDSKRGKGAYVPKRKTDEHVILLGPGVAKLSSLLETLIFEALDPSSGRQVPNLVFLSEQEYDPNLLDFVDAAMVPVEREKLFFLRGSAMSMRDLTRARIGTANIVFLIADISAVGVVEDDNQNISRALEIMRIYPSAKIRMMLLQSAGQVRAVNLGIRQERCFSVETLKPNIFAQSARVKGLATLLAGLLQVTTEYHLKWCEQWSQDNSEKDSWKREYSESLKRQIFGFLGSASFLGAGGMPFKNAVAKAYKDSGGTVLILGAQMNGKLSINPTGYVRAGQVLVAIMESKGQCTQFANNSQDWCEVFVESRSKVIDMAEEKDAMEEARKDISWWGDETEEIETVHKVVPGARPHREVAGGAILVLMMSSSPSLWNQLGVMIMALRESYLPSFSPIVVVCEDPAPDELAKTFTPQGCEFIKSPVSRKAVLGVAEVRPVMAVFVLRSELFAKDGGGIILTDHEVVTASFFIEDILAKVHERHDDYPFAVYEFGSTQAVNLLDVNLRKRIREARKQISQKNVGATTPKLPHTNQPFGVRDILSHIRNSVGLFVDNFRALFEQGLEEPVDHFDEFMDNKLIMQPRFAAGQTFTPDFWGGMLGNVAHFPGTIELVEALVMPWARNQSSFPWQVRCPDEWRGKYFGDLVQAWAMQSDKALLDCGQVLVLALYRRRVGVLPGKGQDGYNVTLPGRSTTLNEYDLITAVGPPRFGEIMAGRGYLHGGHVVTTARDHLETTL